MTVIKFDDYVVKNYDPELEREITDSEFERILQEMLENRWQRATKKDKVDIAITSAFRCLKAKIYDPDEDYELMRSEFEILEWIDNRLNVLMTQYVLMAKRRGFYIWSYGAPASDSDTGFEQLELFEAADLRQG